MAALKQQQLSKFESVVAMITGVQSYYKQADATSRALIETTIGAAIFYLPSSKSKLWSGLISESLVGVDRSQWCIEHMFPRKVSAKKLLNTDWQSIENPAVYLSEWHFRELGRFNYVTKQENQRLKQFQKVDSFQDPEDSYRQCGIRLIKP